MNISLNIKIILVLSALLTKSNHLIYTSVMSPEHSKLVNVLDVAKFFLFMAGKTEEENEPITNMKLQKLVYYAQGYFLAKFDKTLFNDEIKAWPHGPVCPRVYEFYKGNGPYPIECPVDFDTKKFSKDQLQVLTDVWNYYSQYSAIGLRNLTHEEKPWKETQQNQVISTDSMKCFFKTLIE
jgi:uncharacterized phage-associated protein